MNLLKLIKNNIKYMLSLILIIYILLNIKYNKIEHLTTNKEPLISIIYNNTLNPEYVENRKNIKKDNCNYKTPFENDIYKHTIKYKPIEYKKIKSNNKSERSDNILNGIDIKESNNNMITGYEKEKEYKKYERYKKYENKLDININLELCDRDIRKPSNKNKEIHEKQKKLKYRTDTEHKDNYKIIETKLNPDDLLPTNSTGQVYNTDMNYQLKDHKYNDTNNLKGIEKDDYAIYNSKEIEKQNENYFYYDNN